ncbi:type IV toxin-antitoxin system AbiEi family antitoxin [Deinococcus xianganensis]|uniref:Uncharacterized protein n=1 Tax=Deinococcus xianganensis TaxID=1507289 RepID=A0A6I4YDT9_9DEIO|nr:type IV toxin-antitoxin system AbiEi family antitoxin [Deinococcus xianganensis]MXV19662.1 hypothetical protein [Deinococcus xianganensis]
MFTVVVNNSFRVNIAADRDERRDAFNRLGGVLERIPGFNPIRADRHTPHAGRPDGHFTFKVGRKEHHVQFILLTHGYPKQVRSVIHELETTPRQGQTPGTYTVLVAPWFSPETVDLAAAHGYGTLDLSGNYRLHFGLVFLERVGEAASPGVRRQAASLFAPKSARILRALLTVPETDWKVSELVALTGVSQGLVSRVRTELVQRGWAEASGSGVRISAAEELIRSWAAVHQDTPDYTWSGYTLLNGSRLNEAVLNLMSTPVTGQHTLLSGPSAAQWLAPYLRDERQYFQVTPQGFDRLYGALDLESEPSGNVVIRRTDDEGLFLDRIQVAPGYWLTSPVQTYLDLHREGERGQEAAEHLLRTYLQPVWSGNVAAADVPLRAQLSRYRSAL